MFKTIKNTLFSNPGTKLTAFLLALATWALITGREGSLPKPPPPLSEKNVLKEVFIRPRLVKHLPQGLELKDVRCRPERIAIYGPKHLVDTITEVNSEDIPLDKLHDSQTISSSLKEPAGANIVGEKRVEVQVNVEAILPREK